MSVASSAVSEPHQQHSPAYRQLSQRVKSQEFECKSALEAPKSPGNVIGDVFISRLKTFRIYRILLPEWPPATERTKGI